MFKKVTCSILLAALLFTSFSTISFAESTDPFTLVPDNSVFCVRINNLSQSLSDLDQYMAGASPLPIGMMVNMQLAGIVGDPMLTGLDTKGAFCFFAVFPGTEAMEPVMGLLVPVTNYKEFISKNQNCTKFDETTTILASPNSPVGALLLQATASPNYALVVPESEKDTLPALTKAMQSKTATLSKHLQPAQATEAANASVWVHVNAGDLYAKYGGMLTAMLPMLQAGAASEAPPEVASMLGAYFKVIPELLTTFAGGADAVTLAVTPKPQILNVDATFWAKNGSELAKAFVKNPDTSDFTMAGYLDDTNAVNGLMKLNAESSKQMYDLFFDPLKKAMGDSEFKTSVDQFKSSLDKYCDSMGKEMAISFSYGAGTPPFQFYEIIDIKNPKLMNEYMQESMGFVDDIYKAMGLPAEFKYTPDVSTYKNATLGTLSFSFSMPSDPNDEMGEEFDEIMEKMYGKDGLTYHTAQTPDKFYMAMGPNGQAGLKALIDKPAAAASGDFKIALDALKGTPYTDAVTSVNIIKLLKGMGEMMETMSKTMGGEEAAELAGPAAMFGMLQNVPTQSCMVVGGKVADGQAGIRLGLPKQHLTELMAVVMQIQMQKMQQQPGQTPQQDAAPPQPAPSQKSSLQSWIGKQAPELKMKDLNGNIYRISRLKGKTVLLDFWATWCPPCKKSIPDLINLQNGSKDSSLVILGLSDEPLDRLNKFVKDAKMNYPVIAYNDSLPAPYGQIAALPTLMIIDSKGIIRDVLVGYHPVEELQARLKSIN